MANTIHDQAHAHGNPKATIGFVIYYPFQFYVYKAIFLELAEEAEFIVDLVVPLPPPALAALERDIVQLLTESNVPYRILRREEYAFPKYLGRFFSQYEALVSVWERGCLTAPATRHIRKINANYGAGKDLALLRPSRAMFDLILAYGERDAALFANFAHVEIVGNPRFDEWFTDSIQTTAVRTVEERIDPKKKTVLYLPTHGDLSSIDTVAPLLGALAGEYNVIAKTHYFTTNEEPERVAALRESGVELFFDNVDLLPLLRVADVVISDSSSAIFDAILADKPVLLADTIDESYMDGGHKEPRDTGRGIQQGALTYSGSIEQVIKRDRLVATFRGADDFKAALETALNDSDEFRETRARLRGELFAHRDGTSASRAANAIRACIRAPRNFSRPIMHHAFEAFKRAGRLIGMGVEQLYLNEIDLYKRLAHEQIKDVPGVRFSIICSWSERAGEYSRASLQALSELDFPAEQFEIIVLCKDEDERKAARAILSDDYAQIQYSIDMVSAITQSRGEYIAFTNTSIQVRSWWLSAVLDGFNRGTDISCVRGYILPRVEFFNAYDLFDQLAFAREQGMQGLRNPVSALHEAAHRTYGGFTGSCAPATYRKSIVIGALEDIIRSPERETLLKVRALQEGRIMFLPVAVQRNFPQTLRTFTKAQFSIGFGDQYYRAAAFSLGFGGTRIFPRLRDALRAGRAHHAPILPIIALYARVVRALGNVNARFSLVMRAAVLHRDDVHRAQNTSIRGNE